MTKAISAVLSKAYRAEMREAEFAPRAYYGQAEKGFKALEGEYEVFTKESRLADAKPWRFIRFFVDGDEKPYEAEIRGSQVIDTEESIRVARWECLEDFEAPNGTKVPKGRKKLYAWQA